ncbi:MAG: diguanylate cyclase, partial [Gammaproteobacteria bacterium]|nr:diguanylate cyclase [Gammaproteobacteria bacterium]
FRQTVQNKEFRAEGETIHVTVSIGVSQVSPTDTNHILLVERAEKALSLAKNNGCDQVQIFKEDMAI